VSVYCVVATRGRRSPKKRLFAEALPSLSARQMPSALGMLTRKNANPTRARAQRKARLRLPSQPLHPKHLALHHNNLLGRPRADPEKDARSGGRPFFAMGRYGKLEQRSASASANQLSSSARHSWVSFHSCNKLSPSLAGLFVAEVTLALQRIVAASDTQLLVRGGRS
jgi:hypothetical protein